MTRRTAALGLAGLAAPAFADNCASLYDCYSTAWAMIWALLGLIILLLLPLLIEGAIASALVGTALRALAATARVSRIARVLGGLGRGGGGKIANNVDISLATRGFRPPPGTREIPGGIPNSWRILPSREPGGVRYRDPTNAGNEVRVMPGNPNSPYPASRAPYVRWQRNGQPLDANGNALPTAKTPQAHIPLQNFRFNLERFK